MPCSSSTVLALYGVCRRFRAIVVRRMMALHVWTLHIFIPAVQQFPYSSNRSAADAKTYPASCLTSPRDVRQFLRLAGEREVDLELWTQGENGIKRAFPATRKEVTEWAVLLLDAVLPRCSSVSFCRDPTKVLSKTESLLFERLFVERPLNLPRARRFRPPPGLQFEWLEDNAVYPGLWVDAPFLHIYIHPENGMRSFDYDSFDPNVTTLVIEAWDAVDNTLMLFHMDWLTSLDITLGTTWAEWRWTVAGPLTTETIELSSLENLRIYVDSELVLSAGTVLVEGDMLAGLITPNLKRFTLSLPEIPPDVQFQTNGERDDADDENADRLLAWLVFTQSVLAGMAENVYRWGGSLETLRLFNVVLPISGTTAGVPESSDELGAALRCCPGLKEFYIITVPSYEALRCLVEFTPKCQKLPMIEKNSRTETKTWPGLKKLTVVDTYWDITGERGISSLLDDLGFTTETGERTEVSWTAQGEASPGQSNGEIAFVRRVL